MTDTRRFLEKAPIFAVEGIQVTFIRSVAFVTTISDRSNSFTTRLTEKNRVILRRMLHLYMADRYRSYLTECYHMGRRDGTCRHTMSSPQH